MRLRIVLLTVALASIVAAPLAYPMLLHVLARGFSTKITYTEVNEGTERGDVLAGVSGRGTFAGQVRGAAAVASYVAEHVKGVPYGALAKGGTYGLRYDIDGANNNKGLLVGILRAPGLGTVCLSYTVTHGQFKPGDHFIPATGVATVIGGTGQAAKLRGTARFTQKDVTGSSLLTFLADGLLNLSIGSPRPMTSACKAVAKLAKP